jgi:hypothetical protein
MYPSQMIKKLPYGPPLKEPPSGDYCCFITVNITRLKQKKYHEITFFPRMYQYDSETLGKKRGYHISETFKIPYIQSFDKGNYTYHFLESEFNLYKKAFEIDYEVMDRIYFQTSNYLKDDIETLYKAKQTAIDEIQQTNAKLILNSIYGKMATRPTAEMLFFGDENEINQDEYTIKKKNEKLQLANFPCFGLTKKLTNESKTKPIFIASAITAMARVDLLKMIFKMIDHGNRFLYADTDSVIYIENKKVKYPNKDNLGNWKLEKEGDGFKYLAPKTYRLCEEGNEYPIKSASGGLNVDISKQIKNKDYNYQIVAKRIVKKYGQYGINLIENYFNYDKYKDKISEDICPKSLRK